MIVQSVGICQRKKCARYEHCEGWVFQYQKERMGID